MKGMRLGSWAAGLAEGVGDVLFPPSCAFSGVGIEQGDLHPYWEEQLLASAEHPICPRCAANVGPYLDSEKRCPACRRDAFAFDRVYRLGRYEETLAQACMKIKQLHGYRLAGVLGRLLVTKHEGHWRQRGYDWVVPVPLHWSRRWGRGYNQSERIASQVARGLEIPMRSAGLVRRRATSAQTTLTPTARRKNMRGAFKARSWKKLAGQKILLVDDILTTGATCHQAARVLRRAGAKLISVAVVARGDHVQGVNRLY